MGGRVGRRSPESLAGGYGRSPGQAIQRQLRAVGRACWRLVVAVSPLHYDPGDMRRAYRLTRSVLVLCAVLLLLVAGRLVATWLFVSLVTADPPAVAAFNLGGSLVVVACLAVTAVCRARLARHRRAAAARLDRL